MKPNFSLLLFVILLIGYGQSAKAQSTPPQNIDSLQKYISNEIDRGNHRYADSLISVHSTDSLRKTNLKEYLRFQRHRLNILAIQRNPKAGIPFADSLLQLAPITPEYQDARSRILKWRVNLMDGLGQYTKQIQMLDSMLTRHHQDLSRESRNVLKTTLADSYEKVGMSKEALEIYLETIKFYQTEGYEANVAVVHNNIGLLYHSLGEYEKAMDHYIQAYRIDRERGAHRALSRDRNNMSNALFELGKHQAAIDTIKTNVRLHREWGAMGSLAKSTHNLGSHYAKLNKHEIALSYLQESLQICRDMGIRVGVGFNTRLIGNIYWKKNRLIEAKNLLEESLQIARAGNALENEVAALKSLYQIEYELGNYEQMKQYTDSLLVARDELLNERKNRAVQELDIRYETEKRMKENQHLQEQVALREATINLQQRINVGLIIGLVIILGLAGLLIYNYRRLRVAHQKQSNYQDIIERNNEELKTIQAEKDQLLESIAHELRTPLTLMMGPVYQLLEGEQTLTEYTSDKLKLVSRYGERLRELTDQVLALTKLNGRDTSQSMEPVDLVEATQFLVESFSSLAESKQVKLEWKGPVDHALVTADRDKVEKIFTNLLANAIKFTPAGGEVILGFDQVSTDDYVIMVEDSGVGIEKERLPHIFDRFHTNSKEGLGIGLSLVKEYVESHGGTIAVKSKVGEGSTFIIHWPAETEVNAAVELKAQREEDVQEEAHSDHTDDSLQQADNGQEDQMPKILIVDDKPDIRAYIREIVEELGTVREAENGKKALALLQEQPADLVISDIMMDQMDGFEFIQQYRQKINAQDCPIIVVSAKKDMEYQFHGFEIGVNDYIVKPFHPKELYTRVKNMLALKSERDAWKNDEPTEDQEPKDELIIQLEELIRDNIDNGNLKVDDLAHQLAISRRQLYRKLKKEIGLTPAEFVKEIRLQHARNLLEHANVKTVSEVSYAIGFKNTNYFSRLYEERFGRKPITYMG
ncbi:MAG: response regulator [Bacteroidota bacterium]